MSTEGRISRGVALEAERRIAALESNVGRPVTSARLTLREDARRSGQPFVADATMLFEGRVLAEHTKGRSPLEAADLAADRLRRRLRKLVDAELAKRNEDAEPRADTGSKLHPASPKPPEERALVRRRMYVTVPLPTLDAVDDLLALQVEFNLFRHSRSLEDVVVHTRLDGAIGLLHPPGSVLADETDVVVPRPSRYSEPLSLDAARTEMDVLNHRYLYFTDAGDGLGKVLYLRRDGDYGLVEPR